jgi:transposase
MTESGRKRWMFPDAFKLDAVAAVQRSRPVTHVAAEPGLPDRLGSAWLPWATVRPESPSGAPAPPKEQAMPARRLGPSPAEQAAGTRSGSVGARHLKLVLLAAQVATGVLGEPCAVNMLAGGSDSLWFRMA